MCAPVVIKRGVGIATVMRLYVGTVVPIVTSHVDIGMCRCCSDADHRKKHQTENSTLKHLFSCCEASL